MDVGYPLTVNQTFEQYHSLLNSVVILLIKKKGCIEMLVALFRFESWFTVSDGIMFMYC